MGFFRASRIAGYIDELVQFIDSSGASAVAYFACRHHNYNVTALLDSSGAVAERYDYDPYGQRYVLDADYSADADGQSDLANPIGHQGLYHDHETGLIYNRARMLDPVRGRFIQHDPLGYVDGANVYPYYAGMLGGVDPSGRGIETKSLEDSDPSARVDGGHVATAKVYVENVDDKELKFRKWTQTGALKQAIGVTLGGKIVGDIKAGYKGTATWDYSFDVLPLAVEKEIRKNGDGAKMGVDGGAPGCCWRKGDATKWTPPARLVLKVEVYRAHKVTAAQEGGLIVGGSRLTSFVHEGPNEGLVGTLEFRTAYHCHNNRPGEGWKLVGFSGGAADVNDLEGE